MTKRVLIAEDDPDTREALIKHFTSRRYHVDSVANGIRLVEAASKGGFDVIVTDIMMPDLNGVASTEIMKFGGTTTPVIALTGLSIQDVEPLRNTFTKVLHKPINVDELFEYIESLLKK